MSQVLPSTDHVIPASATFEEAVNRLRGRHLPWLLAVEADGRAAGVLSEEDLRLGLAGTIRLHHGIRPHLAPVDRAGLPLDGDGRPLPWSPPSPPEVRAALLMAGGRGARLRPLTDDCPKPLLPVEGRPLLHRILEQAAEAGLSRVWISVCYLAAKVKASVGDGSAFGLEIHFLEEKEPLGTAGALGLLDEEPERLLVMNGDILSSIHLPSLFAWHERHGNGVTVATFLHEVRVPFGLAHFRGQDLERLEEKPTLRLPVNAGIYLFEGSLLREVPAEGPFDMVRWLNALGRRGACGHFPIVEGWTDIGSLESYERHRGEGPSDPG